MPRNFVRVTKYLLAGVAVFCVSWIACVSEWHGGVRWSGSSGGGRGLSTMRTIVAYSEGKRAEMNRPYPVSCDRLPALPELKRVNYSWSPASRGPGRASWQRVPNTRVQLFKAYYDQRLPQHFVRILASFPGRNYPAEEQLYCQTRLHNPYDPLDPNDESVEVVAAKIQEMWYHQWDPDSENVDTPLLLSCPLTEPLRGLSLVSIVTETCEDPSNAFLLEPSKQAQKFKRTFTVCVKDMIFQKDISTYLIEWIETNKLLGVDKIDVYVDHVHKDTENTLNLYQDAELVRLFHVPIKHDPNGPLWQRRRDHIITYNDCLYRNINESEFIIPLDIDEILLPKLSQNLLELVKRLSNRGWNSSQHSAILVQNAFFFDFMQNDKYKYNTSDTNSEIYVKRDDVRIDELESNELSVNSEVLGYSDKNYKDNVVATEKYKIRCGRELREPRLLKHIVRSALVSPEGAYSKSLMLTRNVLMAFNHYPLASVESTGLKYWFAPFREVQLNHYKESCNSTVVRECAVYERRAARDRSALRLAPRLRAALAAAPCGTTIH